MINLTFNKNSYDINSINSQLELFCNQNEINREKISKTQLICEEFLSNILFPNYENEVTLSVIQNQENVEISFAYSGDDYLNKVNKSSILSLKILQNQAKEVISNSQNNITNIRFIV